MLSWIAALGHSCAPQRKLKGINGTIVLCAWHVLTLDSSFSDAHCFIYQVAGTVSLPGCISMLKSKRATPQTTCVSGGYNAVSAHLSGLHSAIKMLVQRVRLVQEVVSSMRSGKATIPAHMRRYTVQAILPCESKNTYLGTTCCLIYP